MGVAAASPEERSFLVFDVGPTSYRQSLLRLSGRPPVVLLKETVEQLDSCGGVDGPTLHLPIYVKSMLRIDVSPPIHIQNSSVKVYMKFPNASYVWIRKRAQLGIVHEVVELCETQTTTAHDRSTLNIKHPAKFFERGAWPGPGERLEDVGWGVSGVVPHAGAISDRPKLVEARGQDGLGFVAISCEHDARFTRNLSRWDTERHDSLADTRDDQHLRKRRGRLTHGRPRPQK